MAKFKEFIISSIFIIATILGVGWWGYDNIRAEILEGVRNQLDDFQKELDKKNKEAIKHALDEHQRVLASYQLIVGENRSEYEKKRKTECPPNGSQSRCALLEESYRNIQMDAMDEAKKRRGN